ncbi:hypothetical protein SUGI_0641200 [Cryptomeria japonica]|nr:hypothetical protein SUGI_0641200 [Cryptomeria japonica]
MKKIFWNSVQHHTTPSIRSNPFGLLKCRVIYNLQNGQPIVSDVPSLDRNRHLTQLADHLSGMFIVSHNHFHGLEKGRNDADPAKAKQGRWSSCTGRATIIIIIGREKSRKGSKGVQVQSEAAQDLRVKSCC